MSQGRFRSFFTGALVGVGLGILLAPKEGSETRNDLKTSFALLVDTIKNIDIEESKLSLLNKVKEIKEELSSISSDMAKDIVKEKVSLITMKCNELISDAKEIGAPVVERVANEVKHGATSLLDEFLIELDEVEVIEEKEIKKKQNTSKPKVSTNKKNTSKKKSEKVLETKKNTKSSKKNEVLKTKKKAK